MICQYVQARQEAAQCQRIAAYLRMRSQAQLGDAASFRECEKLLDSPFWKPWPVQVVQFQPLQAGKALQVPLLVSKRDHGTEFGQPRHGT